MEENLNPLAQLKAMEPAPEKTIRYTIDLTREYHNLLEKEENQRSQVYLWDGNAAGFYDEGAENPQYYLQDELGSPLRIEGEDGGLRESYGYDEFGCDLYQNQGKVQPFGYTGYQHDRVAGTYFAQAREYGSKEGRFISQDLVVGFVDMPFSMNKYVYCFNSGMILVDLDGAWPSWNDIGNGLKNIGEGVGKTVKNAVNAAGKAISSVPLKQALIIAGAVTAVVGVSVITGGAGTIVTAAICGGTTGAAAAVSARAATDIILRQDSSWRDYVADGVGGAIGGAICGGANVASEIIPKLAKFATPTAYGMISGGTIFIEFFF